MRVCPRRHYHRHTRYVNTSAARFWTEWCKDCGAVKFWEERRSRLVPTGWGSWRKTQESEWKYPAVTSLVRGRKGVQSTETGRVYESLVPEGYRKGGDPSDLRSGSPDHSSADNLALEAGT